MVLEQYLNGGMNYRIIVLEIDNGGNGSDINLHGEMWNPSLGLGSLLWFFHSHPGFLCSAIAWCNVVKFNYLKGTLIVWFSGIIMSL